MSYREGEDSAPLAHVLGGVWEAELIGDEPGYAYSELLALELYLPQLSLTPLPE